MSRFSGLYLLQYTKEEFIYASTKVLVERQRVELDLASYIAERAWEVSRDVSEAVRIGKICQNRNEVDEDIRLIQKCGMA